MRTLAEMGGREPQADEVRTRVLAAAEAVFAERGYAGATTREIAERAGIGKRMLFYYFPTKDAVYRAVLERIRPGLVAIFEAVAEPARADRASPSRSRASRTSPPRTSRRPRSGCARSSTAVPHLADLTQKHLADMYRQAGHDGGAQHGGGDLPLERPRPRDDERRRRHALLLPHRAGAAGSSGIAIRSIPTVVAERARMARDLLLHGLAGPAAPKETKP
jgi:AcrR family transcriptional regulator